MSPEIQGYLPRVESRELMRASNATAVETGEVAAWYNNGERDTVIVQTELGRFVTCTPEHRFFLPDGSSAEASELLAGQKIALSQPMFSMEQCVATWKWCPTASMSVRITEDWGRLLGYFMGDRMLDRLRIEIRLRQERSKM